MRRRRRSHLFPAESMRNRPSPMRRSPTPPGRSPAAIETNYADEPQGVDRRLRRKAQGSWTLAGKPAGKEPAPNPCQILLAFDEFLAGAWKRTYDVSYDLSALREKGCTLSGLAEVPKSALRSSERSRCRGARHECDFSYELGCKGMVNGIYNRVLGSPTTCGAVGTDPRGTITVNFSVSGNGHWTLIPLSEPKKNSLTGKTEDIEVRKRFSAITDLARDRPAGPDAGLSLSGRPARGLQHESNGSTHSYRQGDTVSSSGRGDAVCSITVTAALVLTRLPTANSRTTHL
jgi:hypothetical protein